MAKITILPMPGGTASPQLLDAEHYFVFSKSLAHILATESARETLAQLMDGLPLYSVVINTVGAVNLNDAPIEQHTELCNGSRERADRLIAEFDPILLQFEPSILQSFQDSTLDTRHSLVRLLELLARSIHCIAVSIEKTAEKSHVGNIKKAMEYQEPPMLLPPGRNGKQKAIPSLPPYASLFFHPNYRFHEQYPFGTADMAGYWAEDRIFGGVVLFDRTGTEGAEDIWLHSARKGWTLRVWKPLDWQMRAMSKYFTAGRIETMTTEIQERETQLTPKQLKNMDKRWKSTFPFFCDIDNFDRHDDFDAMAYHHIYRDPWERRLPSQKVERCSQRTFDYPERIPIVEAAMYYPGISYSIGGEKRQDGETALPGSSEASRFDKVSTDLIGSFDGKELKYADKNFDMDKYREALEKLGPEALQPKGKGELIGYSMGQEIRAHDDELRLAAELAANNWKLPTDEKRFKED